MEVRTSVKIQRVVWDHLLKLSRNKLHLVFVRSATRWIIIGLLEGLNGVNRQPSNGQKINRQPSKTKYFYRQPSNERAKISRQISQISLNDRDRLTKALSTLSCFQTKTKLFCPVFKKICVHTYRFRIVLARPHYNAESVLKVLLYTQYACSKELDACAFQYISARKISPILDSLLASVRHFGYSGSSSLALRRVYVDDVAVFK